VQGSEFDEAEFFGGCPKDLEDIRLLEARQKEKA
jgi:hypothetical protein